MLSFPVFIPVDYGKIRRGNTRRAFAMPLDESCINSVMNMDGHLRVLVVRYTEFGRKYTSTRFISTRMHVSLHVITV